MRAAAFTTHNVSRGTLKSAKLFVFHVKHRWLNNKLFVFHVKHCVFAKIAQGKMVVQAINHTRQERQKPRRA